MNYKSIILNNLIKCMDILHNINKCKVKFLDLTIENFYVKGFVALIFLNLIVRNESWWPYYPWIMAVLFSRSIMCMLDRFILYPVITLGCKYFNIKSQIKITFILIFIIFLFKFIIILNGGLTGFILVSMSKFDFLEYDLVKNMIRSSISMNIIPSNNVTAITTTSTSNVTAITRSNSDVIDITNSSSDSIIDIGSSISPSVLSQRPTPSNQLLPFRFEKLISGRRFPVELNIETSFGYAIRKFGNLDFSSTSFGWKWPLVFTDPLGNNVVGFVDNSKFRAYNIARTEFYDPYINIWWDAHNRTWAESSVYLQRTLINDLLLQPEPNTFTVSVRSINKDLGSMAAEMGFTSDMVLGLMNINSWFLAHYDLWDLVALPEGSNATIERQVEHMMSLNGVDLFDTFFRLYHSTGGTFFFPTVNHLSGFQLALTEDDPNRYTIESIRLLLFAQRIQTRVLLDQISVKLLLVSDVYPWIVPRIYTLLASRERYFFTPY